MSGDDHPKPLWEALGDIGGAYSHQGGPASLFLRATASAADLSRCALAARVLTDLVDHLEALTEDCRHRILEAWQWLACLLCWG